MFVMPNAVGGGRYIFKGTYEKKFRTSEDADDEDEIEKHRKGRVVSAFEAYWRQLGYPMFVCEPQVKDATLHEIVPIDQASQSGAGASDFAKYVFRPIAVDMMLGKSEASPLTVIEFHEKVEVTLTAPAAVANYMRNHGLRHPSEISEGAWPELKASGGRSIFFSAFPRFGGPAMYYYRRQHDRVFRLTRERFGSEGWYRRALAGVVGVKPHVDRRLEQSRTALESLRTAHGVVHETYEGAARARNLIRQEDEAEYAMKEAVENNDTPHQLLMLLVSLVMTRHACLRILEHDGDRCKTIRAALTADYHDVRDDGDRKEIVLQQLDQALRRNDKTLKSYGLPEPLRRSNKSELQRELKYWERRRDVLDIRVREVSFSGLI